MAKELTPSEYEQMVAAGQVRRTPAPVYTRPILAVVAAVVLCAAGFALGVSYQKHHGGTGARAGYGRFPGRGGFGMRARRAIGQVTAVSSDSITINNQRTGASQTFKITGSTTVDNNGTTGAISDIKTGDTVFIQPSASDSGTASRILLNPGLPSGASQQGTPAQSPTPAQNGAVST